MCTVIPARNEAPPQLQYCKDADPTRAGWNLSLTPNINLLTAVVQACPSSQRTVMDHALNAINRPKD